MPERPMKDDADHLEALIDDLTRAEKKARRRGKPEDWHRLRTTSRRLRGALIAYREAFDDQSRDQLGHWLARRAKRITKLPTKVRDLDVAMDNLAVLEAAAATSDVRRALKDLRRRLEKKRDRRGRALQQRLAREQPVAALTTVLRKTVRRRAAAGRLTPAAAALDGCAATVLAARARIRRWNDDQAMHQLRVAVKKYRGALMALGSGQARPEAAAALEELQRAQQVLGEHHDWSELVRRLRARQAAHQGKQAAAYRALVVRAEQEQRQRFERYRAEVHDRLAAALGAHRSAGRSGTRRRASPVRRSPHPRRSVSAGPANGASGSP
jgi:CHAD domain-containing protein